MRQTVKTQQTLTEIKKKGKERGRNKQEERQNKTGERDRDTNSWKRIKKEEIQIY